MLNKYLLTDRMNESVDVFKHLVTIWTNFYNRIIGENRILVLKLSRVSSIACIYRNHLDMRSLVEGEQPFAAHWGKTGLK